jgi:DNA invertase Pin-like site-specific DNA recombinase
MTRAAIYSRISRTDSPGDRHGVERHAGLCRELCKLRGWDVVEVYEDNDLTASATNPRIKDLVRDLPSKKFDIVVAYEQSRLARDEEDWAQFRKAYVAAGLKKIEFVHGGTTDLSEATGQLTSGVVSVTNAYEKAVIRQRVRDRKDADAMAGAWPGGTRPYGYNVEKPPKPATGSKLVLREGEATVLLEVAERVLDGETLYGIAKDLNERGIASATGRPWRGTVLGAMLRRPLVAGLRVHQGDIIGDAAWPAILDRSTWEQVRAVLGSPSRRMPAPSRQYPLRGILRCERCGRDLGAAPQTERVRDRKAGREPRRWRGYGCRSCGRFVNAVAVERYVLSNLLSLADSPTLRGLMVEEQVAIGDQRRRLIAENATDEETLRELGDEVDRHVTPREEGNRRMANVRARIDERLSRLAALRGESALDRLGGDVRRKWSTFGTADQRAILEVLVDHIDLRRAAKPGNKRFDPSQRLSFYYRSEVVATFASTLDFLGYAHVETGL